ATSAWSSRARRLRRETRERGRRAGRAPTSPGSLGAGWWLEAVRRAALPDLGHRAQEDVLRHGARVPLDGVPPTPALRGPALRVHEDRSDRLRRAALPGVAA